MELLDAYTDGGDTLVAEFSDENGTYEFAWCIHSLCETLAKDAGQDLRDFLIDNE